MALSAFGEGPYGFSFELKRTTPVDVDLGGASAAKENAGLTIATAAPTPNKWANLRREMESVLMRIVIERFAAGCEIELVRAGLAFTARTSAVGTTCL